MELGNDLTWPAILVHVTDRWHVSLSLLVSSRDGRQGRRSLSRASGECCPLTPERFAHAIDPRSSRSRDVTCISLRTLEGGREIARVGLDAELISEEGTPSVLSRLRPKDLLVLSVSVTETTFEAVRTVTHVLIARTAPGATRIEPVSDLMCR